MPPAAFRSVSRVAVRISARLSSVIFLSRLVTKFAIGPMRAPMKIADMEIISTTIRMVRELII